LRAGSGVHAFLFFSLSVSIKINRDGIISGVCEFHSIKKIGHQFTEISVFGWSTILNPCFAGNFSAFFEGSPGKFLPVENVMHSSRERFLRKIIFLPVEISISVLQTEASFRDGVMMVEETGSF